MSETEDVHALAEGNASPTIVEEERRRESVEPEQESEPEPETKKEPEPETREEEPEEQVEESNGGCESPLESEKGEDVKSEASTGGTGGTGTPGSTGKEQPRADEGRIGNGEGRTMAEERTAVGEWNSLPVLVERLRAALEHSLVTGSHRDEEPPALPEDSGIDSEEDFRMRNSMEQPAIGAADREAKEDLKFLEDLLLSDIETALSRLRETLERIDVAALAKHGAASDPSSKIHLLKLVSSLLSRLHIPEESRQPQPRQPQQQHQQPQQQQQEQQPSTEIVAEVTLPTSPAAGIGSSRRRRGTRHTIGVSAEELACARKWLEEERGAEGTISRVNQKREEPSDSGLPAADGRVSEEIRDKCTKDAINQRQSERDKNKEPRLENYRAIAQNTPRPEEEEATRMQQQTRRPSAAITVEQNHRTREEPPPEDRIPEEEAEEIGGHRVGRLVAVLRQRAELSASAGRYAPANKFSAKKSKIKRANTIDIPSYLKLQADSLGQEKSCVSLRRPINVGDKVLCNPVSTIVPSFQPRTENDRKFLALINRNNETTAVPVVNPVAPPFKSFGYLKNPDMASLTNENWNSRFSNIKTNFDRVSVVNEEKEKPRIRPGKIRACELRPVNENPRGNFPLPHVDSGFRPSPSSPFRRVDRSADAKVPPAYQWAKPPVAPPVTNSLREKARMMFDRENVQPQPPSSTKLRRSRETPFEKPSFPRLPWTDHERGESGETITENGRLDYRSFCKQFAPFVGKGSFDSRSNRGPSEEQRNAGVIDGKLSFKMFPDKSAQVQRYPERTSFVLDERRACDSSVKSDRPPVSAKSEIPIESSIRGSSSVAIQTGMSDEHLDEGRSFRVAPKLSKGPAAIYNHAAVQTTPGPELEKPALYSSIEPEANGEWKSTYRESEASRLDHPEDYRGFVLDHNQNYRSPPGDADSPEPIARRSNQVTVGYQSTIGREYTEETSLIGERGCFADEERKEVDKTADSYEPEVDWPVENTTGFLDDRNIQNQDISPEVGVVTRYTCAIATVASVDSPEPRSEEIAAMDSRTSSSPSPSQSWSLQPRAKPAISDEEEIRRHNLLQQSLVRRLQNERTSLNDQRHSPSRLLDTVDRTIQEVASHTVKATANRFLSPDTATIRRQEPPAPRSTSPIPITANRVGALREAYEQAPINRTKQIQKERSPVPNGAAPIDSSDEYLVSCASKPSRSIVLSKSESWHQLALSNHYPRPARMNATTAGAGPPPSQPSSLPTKPPTKPPKSSSSSSSTSSSTHKFRSKQYEASSSSDSVKRMESKIRRYFENPAEAEQKDPSSRSKRSSGRGKGGMIGLSRSRTMPGISEERFRLLIPAGASQPPLLNVNTADLDKVFDDLFQEATRTEHQ